MFLLSLFPFLYKYFLGLSIFLVPEQAKAILENVFLPDTLSGKIRTHQSQAVITTSPHTTLLGGKIK